MINVKEKAKNAVIAVKAKALPVMCAAVTAVPTMMITAFAEDDGSVDYTAVTTSLTTGFKDIVTQCVTVAAAIIPIGLGIIGLGKVFNVAKRFFNKATSG